MLHRPVAYSPSRETTRTPRGGRPWYLYAASVMASACLMSATAHARDHVLIMTISEYPRHPLPGVKHDAAHARALTERLGFDTSAARVVRDQQLTTQGLRREWAELAERVRPNDRVFVYFSGHGASLLEGQRCVSTLVGQEEAVVGIDELRPTVEKIKANASQAIVVLDACHSGGQRELIGARSSADRGAVARPKAWLPEPGQRCEEPINLLRDGLRAGGTRGEAANIVVIAAANEREASLDLPQRGGLATVSLLDCAQRGVADTDGSGSISTREWLACAQAAVDAEVPRINQRENTRWLPHHLEAYGNVQRPLSLALAPASTPTPGLGPGPIQTPSQPAPPPAAPPPLPGPLPSPAPNPLPMPPEPPPSQAARVAAAFRAIEAGSNARWSLQVRPSRTELPLDEEFTLEVDSSQGGYPYLLYVGSDSKDIRQVWPPAGQVRRLNPGLGRLPIRLRATPPAGDNRFLLLVSQVPTDLSAVLSEGRADLNAATLQLLQCPSPRPAQARFPGDPCHGMRNVDVREEPLGEVDGYVARGFSVNGRAR